MYCLHVVIYDLLFTFLPCVRCLCCPNDCFPCYPTFSNPQLVSSGKYVLLNNSNDRLLVISYEYKWMNEYSTQEGFLFASNVLLGQWRRMTIMTYIKETIVDMCVLSCCWLMLKKGCCWDVTLGDGRKLALLLLKDGDLLFFPHIYIDLYATISSSWWK